MSDGRDVGGDGPGGDSVDAALAADREAMRRHTRAGVPDAATTEAALRQALMRAQGGEDMDGDKRITRRRPLIGALVTAAVAGAMLVVPVPYSRTAGHEVRLLLDGQVDAAVIQATAKAWRARSGATRIRVVAGDRGVAIESQVPLRSRRQVEHLASAFTGGLGARGITARAEVTPRTERASGSVYAMARDKVPEIRFDTSQSPEELSASIRSQLDEAGFSDSDVDVQRDGDETQVDITARDEQDGMRTVKKVRMKMRGGGEVAARMGPPVARAPGMTDEQYRDAVIQQLKAEGIEDVDVRVDGERVEVRARRGRQEERQIP